MSEKIQVEFTDRYDGNEPSWLRACFKCEAMGCYPVKAHQAHEPRDAEAEKCDLSEWEREQVAQRIAEGKRESDGWYFLPCPRCNGSARVSWLRTIARIPRWLLRGIPFIWNVRRFNGEVGVWANCWMAFKCAYLVDLGLWKP